MGSQPTSFIAPLVMWFYAFLALIMLMNLLIARACLVLESARWLPCTPLRTIAAANLASTLHCLTEMSSTYERVLEEGTLRWLFERTQLIDEFKDTKPPLPPPFNLISMIWDFASSCFPGADERAFADSGFKSIVDERQTFEAQRHEVEALRRCLQLRKDGAKLTLDARVESLHDAIHKMEDKNRFKIERVSAVLESMQLQLDILTEPITGGKRPTSPPASVKANRSKQQRRKPTVPTSTPSLPRVGSLVPLPKRVE